MLQAAYLRSQYISEQPSAWREGVLGSACFGELAHPAACSTAPFVAVDAPPLDQAGMVGEIWRTGERPSEGQSGPISYRHGDNVLFACCTVDEEKFAPSNPELQGTALQRATEFAYRSIITLIDRLHFPYLLRIWNYVPQINRETDGSERYRQFNIGRQCGFAATARPTTGEVPPASALGVRRGALSVYLLAGRAAPLSIENPRQVSAYHYPREYGARSPTFSRAGLVQLGEQEILFVSGTASIVGHRSVHIDDATAQTRECLTNIQAVLTEANRVSRHSSFGLGDLHYKIYVRRSEDFESVRREVALAVGGSAHTIYLQADICRSELLVEIEASGGHPMEVV